MANSIIDIWNLLKNVYTSGKTICDMEIKTIDDYVDKIHEKYPKV